MQSHMAHDILRAEAVPDAADALEPGFSAHVLDERLGDGLDMLDCVRLPAVLAVQPVHQVKVGGPVQRDGVALEDVRHVGHVAVFGVLVGY